MAMLMGRLANWSQIYPAIYPGRSPLEVMESYSALCIHTSVLLPHGYTPIAYQSTNPSFGYLHLSYFTRQSATP